MVFIDIDQGKAKHRLIRESQPIGLKFVIKDSKASKELF